MTKVRGNLWLGGSADASNPRMLVAAGITAVLNVAIDCNDQAGPGLTWLKAGLRDDRSNPPWMIETAVALVEVLTRCGQKAYVHCVEGRSRAPFVVALYLSRAEKIPFDQAWAELRGLRPKLMTWSKLDERSTS